ncbi:hypothetical protein AX15_000243 [Amanita polypyramis BW_CC]|nr:hypothetical protein AX15_000243 [Amanita polypyramis BW_CC]
MPTDQPGESIQQYASYPFHSDEAFQKGLESILTSAESGSMTRDDTVRRARVFYFNRLTGSSISVDQARQAEEAIKSFNKEGIRKEESQGMSPSTETTTPSAQRDKDAEEEPHPLTFAQLQELIESGREDLIPNNKVIPDKLSDDLPSSSIAPIRRKPWEVGAVEPAET